MAEGTVEEVPMLPAVRAGLGLLFLLAILNGAFLLLVPSQAKTDYAWPIAPAASAAFMGAGYVAGAVGTGVGVFAASRWGSVKALVPGFCALGLVAFSATLVHVDKFRWDYPPTWGWAFVYASLPFGAAALFWLQAREQARQPARAPVRPPAPLAGASYVLGAIIVAVALVFFVAPDWLLADWLWKLTPLLARVFAAWYVLAGITLLVAARWAGKPFERPIPYGTLGVWSALLLLLPLLHADDVSSAPLLAPWLALHAAVLVLCVVATALAARAMRSAGESL